MPSLFRLYVSYLKTALVVMGWTALTSIIYAFIRTSSVVSIVVAALVSLTLSIAVALLVTQYLAPSHNLRRTVAGALEAAAALLLRTASRSGQKHRA